MANGDADAFGEVTIIYQDGVIFVDVASDGFGAGVCITVGDARQLLAQLSAAIQEASDVQD